MKLPPMRCARAGGQAWFWFDASRPALRVEVVDFKSFEAAATWAKLFVLKALGLPPWKAAELVIVHAELPEHWLLTAREVSRAFDFTVLEPPRV